MGMEEPADRQRPGVAPQRHVSRSRQPPLLNLGRIAPAWPPGKLAALWAATVTVSTFLMVFVGALGTSATSPALGPGTGPPWSLQAGAPDILVTSSLVLATLLGTTAVLVGLAAVKRGWRPRPAHLLAGAALAVVALILVPPMGSGDHLNYAAYGRIAATGGDPYVTTPRQLGELGDPVGLAVTPPWPERGLGLRTRRHSK